MRLGLLLLCCGLLLSTTLRAGDEDISIRKALNISIRQQALTQRIAKIYLALNHNLYEPTYYQDRDAAIAQFQEQLDEIKHYAPTSSVEHDLEQVNKIWREYKAIADWSINEQGAEKLLEMCDPMLDASNQLFRSYQAYNRTMYLRHFRETDVLTMIQLIKNTGLQRMLTQRIMLYYLAAKQDINADVSKKKLAEAVEQYQASLKYVSQSPMNSRLINEKLEAAFDHWTAFSNLLKSYDNSQEQVDQMIRTADKLYDIADEVSLLYEDLGHKLSLGNAINIAADQNMLTQKIAKSYVAMAYGQNTTKHRRELLNSIDLFEEQMLSMRRSSEDNEEFKDAVNVVQTMWKNYRKLVTNWENMDDITVVKVLERANIMMATCDNVGVAIEKYAQGIPDYRAFFEDAQGNAIDPSENIAHQMRIAGAQRAYSQRIAIYFMMNALNIDTQLSKSRFDDILGNYRANAQALNESPIQDKDIKAQLKKADKQWAVLEQHLAAPNKDKIEMLLDESAALLATLDDLNEAYEGYMDEMFRQNR